MVFSSLQFIFIFMPLFFGLYYAVPKRMKNAVLLAGSLCFYFVGTVDHPEHFIIFLTSILVDFFMGLLMEKHRDKKKLFLILSIAFHLLHLAAFKYSGFVFGEIKRFTPGFDFALNLTLPIGISFYTFQGLSYVADVYRGGDAEKSLLRYAVYISMFPQLIAGPIVTYSQVKNELKYRKTNKKHALRGLGVFIFGLGLKVLLANPLGKMWSGVCAIGFESLSTPLAWMAVFAFSFQLYFDFFGYSLMALGLGEMLGFRLPKNFDHPYQSLTMTQFWRRWHITLGSWFREYVYIPLGGNRRGKLCGVRNLLVVWLLTGIWHGAGYNFLLWGLILFVIILIEKLFIGKYLSSHTAVGHVYMIIPIPLTWAVFAVGDMGQLAALFSRLLPFFGQGSMSVFRHDWLKYLSQYYPFFIAGILLSFRQTFEALKKIKNRTAVRFILLAILSASVYCMYRGFDDPFLYFRF